MKTYLIDITVEIDADTAEDAWRMANNLVSDYDRVVNVSEPEDTTCIHCDGKGYDIQDNNCDYCDGTGKDNG